MSAVGAKCRRGELTHSRCCNAVATFSSDKTNVYYSVKAHFAIRELIVLKKKKKKTNLCQSIPGNVTHWAFKNAKEHNALTVIQCFSLAFLLPLNSSLLFLHSAPVKNADVWPKAARPGERKGGSGQRCARSSSSSPHPRPLPHMKGAARGRPGPVDDRWGVCYARAPDPDTTQHTALRATTAGLECDLLQTWPRVRETQVEEGGGHGWRDVGNGGYSVSMVPHENCFFSPSLSLFF